jgi:hypothetical protein
MIWPVGATRESESLHIPSFSRHLVQDFAVREIVSTCRIVRHKYSETRGPGKDSVRAAGTGTFS